MFNPSTVFFFFLLNFYFKNLDQTSSNLILLRSSKFLHSLCGGSNRYPPFKLSNFHFKRFKHLQTSRITFQTIEPLHSKNLDPKQTSSNKFSDPPIIDIIKNWGKIQHRPKLSSNLSRSNKSFRR